MDHLSRIINHGLTKASQQYAQELYDSEFTRVNLPPPPLFPVLDIFTPNGFSSNFGLEQVVKRVNGEGAAKNREENEEMETDCDSDYSMHSICAKCRTDFAPFFIQQKIDDKVELLCRDCHIRWREEQDRERKISFKMK
ncbi:Oidioi.mRNA.OKI2018_I69.XSR.g15554.t1.cds [Oikopleura dioica]|uniref:Oidioi.mRNA.OKI2018_I69.XSR.g15554.t1.cds n=1 Tax=Oikopleura dioica TaxID=34765 RepID=A0ABN7SMF7_OIKDI|nr:Oidioi.mRNA.OKI2018_I69.XSR.g15554.t1.cds [Oikopleura dioica]